jgi:hypothetical protein
MRSRFISWHISDPSATFSRVHAVVSLLVGVFPPSMFGTACEAITGLLFRAFPVPNVIRLDMHNVSAFGFPI